MTIILAFPQNPGIGALMDHKEEKMKDKKVWVFNYVLVTGYMRSALRLGERFSVDQVQSLSSPWIPIFSGRVTQDRMLMFLNQILAVRSQCRFQSATNYEITPTENRYPGRWRTLYGSIHLG